MTLQALWAFIGILFVASFFAAFFCGCAAMLSSSISREQERLHGYHDDGNGGTIPTDNTPGMATDDGGLT